MYLGHNYRALIKSNSHNVSVLITIVCRVVFCLLIAHYV